MYLIHKKKNQYEYENEKNQRSSNFDRNLCNIFHNYFINNFILEKMEKLKIVNAEIVFANLKDDGFGTSLTFRVTPEMEKQIIEFWATNKIGKTEPGVAKFKEYEGKKQFNCKITENTKFAYINGTSEESLGFGAKVNMFIQAFEYNNKFTKGQTMVGANISAVVVTEGRKTGADADLSDLLNEIGQVQEKEEEEKTTDLPF